MSTFESNFEKSLQKSNAPILNIPDFNSYRTGPVFEAPQPNSYPENLHVLNLPKFDELKTGPLYETASKDAKETKDTLPKVELVDSRSSKHDSKPAVHRHAYSTLESMAYENGGNEAVKSVQQEIRQMKSEHHAGNVHHHEQHRHVERIAHNHAAEQPHHGEHKLNTEHRSVAEHNPVGEHKTDATHKTVYEHRPDGTHKFREAVKAHNGEMRVSKEDSSKAYALVNEFMQEFAKPFSDLIAALQKAPL
jgi:hypothetical protein